MEDIVTIEFMYKHKAYYALARIKEKSQHKEYHITIMNGALEKILYGNHIFVEEEDGIVLSTVPESNTNHLRMIVGLALCKHFNKQQHHSAGDAIK